MSLLLLLLHRRCRSPLLLLVALSLHRRLLLPTNYTAQSVLGSSQREARLPNSLPRTSIRLLQCLKTR